MSRSSQRAEAKRQQILQAARQLFLKQGYARTTTDAVTQAAGISKETLYSYFKGKAGLLVATVNAEFLGLERLHGALPPARNLPEFRTQLLEFAQRFIQYTRQPEVLSLLRLLAGEAMHVPELRPLVKDAVPNRTLRLIQQLLSDAQTRGLIQVPDLDLSARMFAGPLLTYAALDGLFAETPAPPPTTATLQRLVDSFLLTVALTETSSTFDLP